MLAVSGIARRRLPYDRARPAAGEAPCSRFRASRGGGCPMTEPRRLRLFVALDLPDDVVKVLAALGAAADQAVWRPVAPEALHVTLAFLGGRPEEDVAVIAPIVAAEHTAPPLALANVLLL